MSSFNYKFYNMELNITYDIIWIENKRHTISYYRHYGMIFTVNIVSKEFKVQLDSNGIIAPSPFCTYCDNAYTTHMV